MRKNKLLLLLALLMTAATGAWATDYTTLAVGDVIKVGDTFSPTADGVINNNGVDNGKTYTLIRADIDNDYNVTEKTDGAYYVFKYVSIMSSPYIHFDKAFEVTAISDGLEVTKFETVKGYLFYTLALHESAAASGYTVSLKDGVKDADKWTVKVGEGQAQALPIGGLKGDGSETVTLQYTGRLKVKGVKATSDAVPAKEPATVTTAPTGAAIVGRLNTNSTELVSGGVADGGTLWYAVTTTNTKPTSTAGFSDAVPTAKDITASGTVYVWYYVKGDDTHSDSEIAATAIEVPVADIVWDATNIRSLRVMGTFESYEREGVTLSGNAEQIVARWRDKGDPTTSGIQFDAMESGGYTFTAPTGKKFTKIVMTLTFFAGWDNANLGSGWSYSGDDMTEIYKVTWTGTAASTVGLLKDAGNFGGERVKSIVFYLSE